jgi:acetylornithine deacetylase/succinyl-diaminopimelate desuccinylase-like protein
VLQKGAHSGVAGGIVPSSFRIARQLLARLEDQFTGQIIDELQVKIPEDKMEQASFAAQLVGKGEFEFIGDAQPVSEDPFELYLNNIWRPQLEVIGQEGIPSLSSSGNVLRHQTVLRLSLRLPPGAHWEESFAIVKGKLESSPPYQAEVRVELVTGADGWSSNEVPPKVMKILDSHNEEIFGSKTLMYGTGGSIPFVNMIQDRLPQALVLITGCDLPSSNIHAPDENIDPRFLGRFAQSLACFLADYTTL